MTLTNNRVLTPQAMTIVGIDAGGMMNARISAGYDDMPASSPDGAQVAFVDRASQYVRGSLTSQDWVEIINILTGTGTSIVFYEAKSGAATFVKHTINNPVISRVRLSFVHRKFASVTIDFECRFSASASTIADVWAMTDSQTAPTYLPAARGFEISAAAHGASAIYHPTALDFEIAVPVHRASHDGDKGYTAVDAVLSGMMGRGSLSFQDSGIATAALRAVNLMLAARASLVLTVKQSQAAADKTLTIAGVIFGSADSSPSADGSYTEYNAPFVVTNDATTMLTLAGTNKILTIA